ncbi:MAG: YHYH protein, partial [Verrucomicrobiota bacterium]
VDGVALFDATDSFSYINSTGLDGSPLGGGPGDGVWNRDAYVNEHLSFDAAFAHQAMNQHHYHVNAPALRYLLGDSVDHDPALNVYTEDFNGAHSPIVGWAADGHPVYGPYGYSDPNDPDSGVRRMISGYQKRNGSNGSSNLGVTGRGSLPEWANRLEGRSTTLSPPGHGPNVSPAFRLGHYLEDYAYKGDLVGLSLGADFDLDEYNGRFCVTPDFPGGVWAYFTVIEVDGTPVFPYTVGRNFYGTPSGMSVGSIPETAERFFIGGPGKPHRALEIAAESGAVMLSWDTVEGADYQLAYSPDLGTWTDNAVAFTADATTEQIVDNPAAAVQSRFYRLERTGIAGYDTNGFSNVFGDGPTQPETGFTPGTSTTVSFNSARGVTLSSVVVVPATAVYGVVVLLEGGDGKIAVSGTPEETVITSNGFLARNATTFSDEGLVAVVVDIPSDFTAEGIDVPYRVGPDQATDLEAVLDWIAERSSLPVWVIGMSLGGYSACNSAIRLGGKMTGFGVCSASTSPPGAGGVLMPTGVLELDLDQILVPSLVIGHQQDACPGTLATGVSDIVAALTHAASVDTKLFTGGNTPVSHPCGPLSYHGYYGIDAEVVAYIANSIK